MELVPLADGPHFRIEFREATTGAVEGLGPLAGGHPHHSALEPFLSRLLQEGKRGVLELVDADTGTCVARRRVAPRRAAERVRPRNRGVAPFLFGIEADEGSDDSMGS
jgi:hypothetical protein